ncbi:unnamed protein product [Meloidogyne enterolobii]|uniref:Uncharacterized protein n=1 Tax=Meloidogyne enterolobii TaxID=390850 RepID=A0ACB0ZMC1_MELEN
MEEGEEEFVELEEKVSGECDDLEVIGEEDDYRYDLEEKENEDCFGLKEIDEYSGDLKKILEEKGDEQGILEYKLDVFEKDPEKEIQPTRDKFKVLKENENIVEKRKMLRLKLREAIILARLRCDLAGKEILWNNFGEDFGYGILKRKITGRFFLGVRRCLNVEKLITLIRVSELSRNFLKEINRRMLESKPVKVLYLVSVTKQDVIRDSKGVEIEKDWKKRKRKEGKGLVESVSVTEILTIGVLMETFHRRSGSLNRVGLENPMITLTLRIPKSNKRKELPRHPRPFAKTDRTRRSYSDVEDAVI